MFRLVFIIVSEISFVSAFESMLDFVELSSHLDLLLICSLIRDLSSFGSFDYNLSINAYKK
jgi:hypothetical protein